MSYCYVSADNHLDLLSCPPDLWQTRPQARTPLNSPPHTLVLRSHAEGARPR